MWSGLPLHCFTRNTVFKTHKLFCFGWLASCKFLTINRKLRNQLLGDIYSDVPSGQRDITGYILAWALLCMFDILETIPWWTECPVFLLELQIAQGHKIQNMGLKLTVSISSFHVCGSHFQDADILLFLHPCLHFFLDLIICLNCLIFLLHLLRAWWLLMADLFSSDGTFLGKSISFSLGKEDHTFII